MREIVIILIAISIGFNQPKLTVQQPVRTPPTPELQKTVAQQPKERHKPLWVNYASKPPPKGNKVKREKARPMSEALRKLYERLDDWQYAGPLPYDPIYNGTPDPYPMPEFDKQVKAHD